MDRLQLHFCVEHIKEAGNMVKWLAQRSAVQAPTKIRHGIRDSTPSRILERLRKFPKGSIERKAELTRLNKNSKSLVLSPGKHKKLVQDAYARG